MLHFFIILGTKVLNHHFTGFTTVQVYEIFGHLALLARSSADSYGSSFANELLMIVRKQVPRIIFFSFGALQHKHDQTSLNHTFMYDHFFTLIQIDLFHPSVWQVTHPDLNYKKMGLVGTLKIVSCLGDATDVTCPSPSQVRSSSISVSLFHS